MHIRLLKGGQYLQIFEDGKVTAVAPGSAVIYYKVYDGYGVPHTESCNVTVIKDNAVEGISGDISTGVDIYTLNGVSVTCGASPADLKSLPAGLYIIRQGTKTCKIMVK